MLKFRLLIIFLLTFAPYSVLRTPYLYAQDESKSIIVNGDVVEYSTEKQEVTAAGNVSILYKGAKLTCEKITVNTATKVGVAEGNARLEDEKGIILGSKIIYDFQNKKGEIVDAEFRSQPFFGRAKTVQKISDAEFIALNGYMSTCNLDNPHFRFKSKKIDFFPKDKAKINGASLYVGKAPLFYLPKYVHSFKDPTMHVQLVPGHRKDWGAYMLSAWHYSITENISGRIYFDYRQKFGLAEGFGTNYSSKSFGRGDFKYYYTHETPNNLPDGTPNEFQRYLVRWRHRWDVDPRTNVISEYYKIVDSKRAILGTEYNILKDYFPREYEKDSQPLSYLSAHHSFTNSSIDLVIQKRVNHWYDQLDKLPEIKYTLPSMKLGDSPFYFENNSVFDSFHKKSSTAPVSLDDVSVTRLDTTNKLSWPMKVAFLDFTPFVKDREIAYDRGANGKALPVNSVFYAGAYLSTKFYRVFNVKTNFLGLGLDGFRHIITPTVGYSYNPAPTINNINLKQIDSVDLLTSSNAATLELSNKLQTKRKDINGKETTVDFVDFNVSTSYAFAPRIVYGTNIYYQQDTLGVNVTDISRQNKLDASISDILFRYKILPYSWLRIEGDATYKHSGVVGDSDYENYNHFSNVNYDINFDFAPERSFGLGQRYQRKAGNQLTTSFKWRLNPKWKLSVYERYNLKQYTDLSTSALSGIRKGSLEQECTLSRDLHCWEMDLTLHTGQNNSSGIFIIFRLKAFPEMELKMNQNYYNPKSGAQ